MQMSSIAIRDADAQRDAPACALIYAPHVQSSATSFEEQPPVVNEIAERIARTSETHPWLVAEDADVVVGYAYACPHRTRPAYRWSADVSVYVADGYRGQGIGRSLYEALFERLRDQRYRMACAGITLPNEASVALHEQLGFVPVGVFREIGWKAGAWRDVGWWQLDLASGAGGRPTEPLPPAAR
jgi:L-amino acid N-acyltransferase YncA